MPACEVSVCVCDVRTCVGSSEKEDQVHNMICRSRWVYLQGAVGLVVRQKGC